MAMDGRPIYAQNETFDLPIQGYVSDIRTGIQGIQGIPGEKGATGDVGPIGPAGAAGYSPVKGVDYFTAADQAAWFNPLGTRLDAAESAITSITTQLGTLNDQLEGALNGN